MKYLIALIVSVVLFSTFMSVLGFDYNILTKPLDEMKIMANLAVFFVIYSLVRWLIDNIFQ